MRLGFFAFLAATLVAASARADFDWLPYATVSQTLAVSPSRLCMGASQNIPGRHLALGCPSYAPSITTGGDVSITGNVSANKFIGDGSGLTGVTAGSSDRIVSGTTSMVAISTTGYISLTQSGVNTGWFNPQTGFVTIGVSSTGVISGTGGYFSGDVYLGNSEASIPRGLFFGTTKAIGIAAHSTSALEFGTNLLNAPSVALTTGYLNLGTLGLAWQSSGDVTGSTSGDIGLSRGGAGKLYVGNGTRGDFTGTLIAGGIGVGTVTPTATLQVSGTFIVSNSSQVTTPSIYVSTGTGRVGFGTSSPNAPVEIAENGSGEALRVSRYNVPSQYMSFNEASGASHSIYAYGLKPLAMRNYSTASDNGGGIAFGVANGDVVDITVNRRVGINTNYIGTNISIPSQTLHVSGTALITSWTGINFSGSNVTPTAPLEVSGTISATALVINGQSITGGGGDRITSGTSSVVVNSATSTISFTTAGSQRMTIDGSGNVGIGIVAPTHALQVYGDAYMGIYSNGANQVILNLSNTARSWKLLNETTGELSIADGSASNAKRLTVATSGNIGIGTSAPSQSLDVSGTARIASNTAIGMNATPSATLEISGTMKLSGGTGSEVCDTPHYGTMRQNPSTGEMEICTP